MTQNNPKQDPVKDFENYLFDTLMEWTDFDPNEQIAMAISSKLNEAVNTHTTKLLNEMLDRLEATKEDFGTNTDQDEYVTVTYVPLTAIEKEREKLK